MQLPAFNSRKTIKTFASYVEWNPLTYFQVTGDAPAPNAFFRAGASPEVIQLHCKSRPYKHAMQRRAMKKECNFCHTVDAIKFLLVKMQIRSVRDNSVKFY